MELDMEFVKERYALCIERIREIAKEQEVPEKYQEYFKKEDFSTHYQAHISLT